MSGGDDAAEKTTMIRTLNDSMRAALPHVPSTLGLAVLTPGIQALDAGTRFAVVEAVKSYSAFDKGDDPYGHHDFGAVTVNGNEVFWKIDYYERNNLNAGSEEPWSVLKTTRVLTIMLSEEY